MTAERLRRVGVATGVELSVRVRNPAGTGLPMLLVHGLASNARLWDGVGATLSDAGHPVAAVDQRGHGQSSKPDDGYDFPTFVSDLVAVIDALGWERPLVAGQSFGGNVVIELAATHPERVAAVVAVDGGFIELAGRFASWDECAAALAPPRLVGTSATQIEQWMRRANPDWPESGIVGAMGNFEVRHDGTIAPWLTFERHMLILRALYGHRPSERFPHLDAATLLVPADTGDVAWTHDKRVAVDSALAALRHGRAHWFSPAHHDIHAQHPHELAQVMMRFAEEATDR
jgi:pimeloyl-ACP methyl ester carboxylesterase